MAFVTRRILGPSVLAEFICSAGRATAAGLVLTQILLPFLEMSEQLIPEEEAEETEAWAKPLSQLWQNRPPNFEAEKEFNETMAQQAPHCSVCMIFQIYNQVSPRLPLCLPRTSSQREARLIVGTELVTGCLGKGMFF